MSRAPVTVTITVNADQMVDALTRAMFATWRRWPHTIPPELRDEFERLAAVTDDANVQRESDVRRAVSA